MADDCNGLTNSPSEPAFPNSTTGFVSGPATSTSNAIVRWSNLTGTIVKDSKAIVDNNGSINIPTAENYKKNSVNIQDVVETLTNKRNQPRPYSVATTGTLTPEIDTYNYYEITNLTQALNIANHVTSTPVAGEMMLIVIVPDATPRALTYGTNYAARAGVALPTTTVASKLLSLLFVWVAGSGINKWNLLATGQE